MPPKVQKTLHDFLGPNKGKDKTDAIDVDYGDTTSGQKRRRDASPTAATLGATDATALPEKASRGEGLVSYITDPEWRKLLKPILEGANFQKVENALAAEYANGKEIFPPKEEIFTAFNHTPVSKVRVVLIGQDPYHDNGQAHGLCFSVKPGIKPPPSLVNMYKELATDIDGFKAPSHGFLLPWADQGVLMLNATLTVEAHKANSHAKIGWQEFTDDVIKALCKERDGLVFLLWGGFAQKKLKSCKIDEKKHIVIQTGHPSPLSVKHWIGCKTFSKCNNALKKLGKDPIDWRLPPVVAK